MGNVKIKVQNTDNHLADYTVLSLRYAIRETRQEPTGVPLDVIAWVINDELTKSEVESLVKHLTAISSSVE